MKIYKNNVCVSMSLEELLDILESNLFDQLLELVMELDGDSPSTIEKVYGDYDDEIVHEIFEVENIDEFMGLLREALDEEGIEYDPGWEIGNSFMSYDPELDGAWWGTPEAYEEPKPKKKGKKQNQHDAKVKRILDRYKDVTA